LQGRSGESQKRERQAREEEGRREGGRATGKSRERERERERGEGGAREQDARRSRRDKAAQNVPLRHPKSFFSVENLSFYKRPGEQKNSRGEKGGGGGRSEGDRWQVRVVSFHLFE